MKRNSEATPAHCVDCLLRSRPPLVGVRPQQHSSHSSNTLELSGRFLAFLIALALSYSPALSYSSVSRLPKIAPPRAGCRLSKGVGKRAQAPARDRSQACFSRVIMRAFMNMTLNLRVHVT